MQNGCINYTVISKDVKNRGLNGSYSFLAIVFQGVILASSNKIEAYGQSNLTGRADHQNGSDKKINTNKDEHCNECNNRIQIQFFNSSGGR